jgi:hypothetical protein
MCTFCADLPLVWRRAGRYGIDPAQWSPSCSGACAPGRWGGAGETHWECSGECSPGRWGGEGQTHPGCSGECFAGYACSAGSGSATQVVCPAGQYSEGSASSCWHCPAGELRCLYGCTCTGFVWFSCCAGLCALFAPTCCLCGAMQAVSAASRPCSHRHVRGPAPLGVGAALVKPTGCAAANVAPGAGAGKAKPIRGAVANVSRGMRARLGPAAPHKWCARPASTLRAAPAAAGSVRQVSCGACAVAPAP